MKLKRQLYCVIYNEVLWNFKQDMILNLIVLKKNKKEIEKKIQEVIWYDWSRIAGDNLISGVLYRHFQEWGDRGTEKAGEEGFIKLYQSSWEKTGWDHQIFICWHSKWEWESLMLDKTKCQSYYSQIYCSFHKLCLYSMSYLREKVH